MAMTMEERLTSEIDSFNHFNGARGRTMRLKMIYTTATDIGQLVLGTDAQFEHDVYQAVVAEGVTNSINVATALRIFACAER